MKNPLFPLLLSAVVFSVTALPAGGETDPLIHSALWGEAGELWNPASSRLRDFTNVGYMGGAVPIPNWPVGVSVTDPAFGATPDDDTDDTQAFIAAIAACPNHRAVFVPKGRYIITGQIKPLRNHFVLRGEDMYKTVLFFPKYLDEAYLQEIGWTDDGARNTGSNEGFITMDGGVEKSIENLSLVFREQRKGSVWDYIGADPLCYKGNVTNSWVRNLYVKNYDLGFKVTSATNLSVINLLFDQFNGRRSSVGSSVNGPNGTEPLVTPDGTTLTSKYLDALFGVMPRSVNYSLFHNVDFRGQVMQPFDLNESSSNNVYSTVRATLRAIGYHGGSAKYNLYTDLNNFVSTPGRVNFANETYWGVDSLLADRGYLESVNNVYVGYGDELAAKTDVNDPTIWYEPIDPAALTPRNLYLAQMALLEKPLPEAPPAAMPSPYAGDVFRVLPTDDNVPGAAHDKPTLAINGPYFKFDLSGIDVATVAHARFRVNLTTIINTPFKLEAWQVNDDSWAEATLTTLNQPPLLAALDSIEVKTGDVDRVLEFDVTPFVRSQLVGGDSIVSLCIKKSSGSGLNVSFFSLEGGIRPELVIERVPSAVPGAPSAPKGIRSTPKVGNIILDWDDTPEADVAAYNVYRVLLPLGVAEYGESSQYKESHASGLTTSDFVDIQSATDWRIGMMDHRIVYKYKITAVDEHGYESPRSREFVAATLHPSNAPPAFNGTVNLANAKSAAGYNGSLSTKASDPESDAMYFMKVSGPDWLNVALDGTLSGEPQLSDAGLNTFTLQVTAVGGSAEAVVEILVDAATVVPGPPAIPSGLSAKAGNGAVFLEWAESADIDFKSYRLYRSTQSGSYGNALAEGLSNTEYLDLGVENGVTYFYTLRAVDNSGNLSLQSHEVVAAPAIGNITNVANYPFTGSVRTSNDTDATSTASTLSEGGGLTIGYETRSFGDTANFGNPPPSLKWTNSNANNGIILDDDYLSFTITANTGSLTFHSLSFDERVNGQNFQLFSSQDGFATMAAVIDAPRTTTTVGTINTHTIWLSEIAEIPSGSSIEFRLYINTTATIGESWIDNLRLTRFVDSGATSLIQTSPSGLVASAVGGGIRLDWSDHPGPDLAGYHIYRSAESGAYGAPLATGVANSEYVDATALGGTRYHYVVSAVNTVGGESPKSAEAAVIATGPTPTFIADPIEKSNAALGRPYHGTLSDHVNGGSGSALSFSNISGPTWLTVSSSGQLGGRPEMSDVGVNTWTVEVSDGSGADQALLQIPVSLTADHDADGIDDNWEWLHFGSMNAINGSLDSDGDGVADFFEYLHGSRPMDSASRGFQMTAKADTPGTGTVFTWETLQGFSFGTDYQARVSTNLSDWDLLQQGDYQLEENPVEGVTRVTLRLSTAYNPNAFLRLQQP